MGGLGKYGVIVNSITCTLEFLALNLSEIITMAWLYIYFQPCSAAWCRWELVREFDLTWDVTSPDKWDKVSKQGGRELKVYVRGIVAGHRIESG